LMVSRYLLRSEDGRIAESPKQMFQRIAMTVVIPDILYDLRIFQKEGGLQVFPKEDFNLVQYAGKLGLGRTNGGYMVTWNEHHLERMKTLYDELNSQGKMKVSWNLFLSMLSSGEFDSYYQNFKTYYDIMVSKKFMPNSPTLFNAGTRLGQLSACFVLDIEDNIESIMKAATHAAIIFKSGGGIGINYSKLRPAGDIVSSTSGVASGPVSFMRIVDTVTDVVKQGGKRRGANMGILEIDHPDIEAFITAKAERGKLENFNISVLVNEDFWSYLDKDAQYPLINPRIGKIWKTASARDIFWKIAEMAWRTGDPGVVFLDNINRRNILLKHKGPIRSTNPCVSGDTKILTPEGWIEASELFYKAKLSSPVRAVATDESLLGEGGEPQAYRTRLMTIRGREIVYRTVRRRELNLLVPIEAEAWVWHVGKNPGLVVRTEEGYELKVTRDHKLLTPKGWRKAEDLVPGEKILIGRLHPWFLENAYRGSYDLDDDVSFALGWLIGKGSFNKHYVAWLLSKDDETTEERLRRGIGKIGGNPLSHTYLLGENRHKIQYDEGTIVYRNVMNLIGSQAENSNDRRLPGNVWRLSSRSLAFFLRGLFTANGYVDNDGAIRLTSTSLQLLKEVQLLLTIFGIASKIHGKPCEGELNHVTEDCEEEGCISSGYYELVINGYSRNMFKELVGLNISEFEKLSLKKTKKDTLWATVFSIEDAGLLDFYDFTIPTYHRYIGNGLVNHNCGEEPLYPYESCNLGSINLHAFLKREGEKSFFDWDEFDRVVRIALRFLDNVIDVNKFPLPEIERETKLSRKVGLGIMGLADMFFALGIPYNSEEGFRMMNRIGEHLTFYAMKESCVLAGERGVFPLYNNSSYPEGEIPIEGFYHEDWQTLPWKELQQGILKSGVRNAEVTTIAPTGSISMLVDTSSGIEPQFALIYEKRVTVGTFYYIDTEFERALRENGLYDEKILKQISDNGGSLMGIDSIPENLRRVFLMSYDIPWWDHVRAQAEFTKWICAAVSKTVNMPRWVTVEDVQKAFILAHIMGVKGITVYREGSLPSQVLVAPFSRIGRYIGTVDNSTIAIAKSLGVEIKGFGEEPKTMFLEKTAISDKPTLVLEREKENAYSECPNCGGKRLFSEGGCLTCLDCGWSICPVA
ncbi:MAG: ribonucleotide reductase N-terminal alpha domain-containing protein, partial [Thermoproteota archaeon]